MTVGVYPKQLSDGNAAGTKLGQSATDLVGFFGATPIAQPVGIADATDATSVIAKCNLIITALESLGIIATV